MFLFSTFCEATQASQSRHQPLASGDEQEVFANKPVDTYLPGQRKKLMAKVKSFLFYDEQVTKLFCKTFHSIYQEYKTSNLSIKIHLMFFYACLEISDLCHQSFSHDSKLPVFQWFTIRESSISPQIGLHNTGKYHPSTAETYI